MTQTGYSVLKDHFDKLFLGGYPGNGLEQIRDTYQFAFNTKIHLYDIYQTNLRVANNPISKIITLAGPDNPDIESGIIPCIDEMNCVNIFDKSYHMGLTEDNVNDYAEYVYSSMVTVVSADSLYNLTDPISRTCSPYSVFLNFCPLYFTYHHIKYVDPELVESCSIFKDTICRYVCSEEDVEMILKSLSSSKYSSTFEGIYSTMTCNNTVELNW